MNPFYFKPAAIIGILMAWSFFMFMVGFNAKKCPTITTGTVTVKDTLIRHDTIKITSYRDNIKVVEKPITKYVTVHDTVRVETANVECYQIDTTVSDGAHIVSELCSSIFPPDRPIDLVGHIWYKPPDLIQRTYMRVDTVSRPHFWRDFKIAGISLAIGGAGALAVATHFYLKR